uniref:Set2 Rpb1 interacting domain-containing protein n=1 Tax=Glossina morsitans morsitans TaxID=37546 RepID=A0A1B0GBL9_GLOMM
MDIVEDKDAEFNQLSSEMKSPLLALIAGALQDVKETEATGEPKQIDEVIVNEYHPVATEVNNEITQETTASSSIAVTEDLISEAVVIPVSPTPEECPVADEKSEVLKINEISASRQEPEMPSAVVEDTKHVITIPKKRGRKPRFRNLHEPELLEKVVASTTTNKEIVESSISNNFDLRTVQNAAEYNIKVQPISGAEVVSSRTAHIPIQRSEHQYFEKNALTKSAESEEYEAQIAPNVDTIKTTEHEEEKKSTTTEHQLLPLDVLATHQSDLEIEEEKKSKSNDVNSGLGIEVVDHQIDTDARSGHLELKEESKSLSTLLMNEITEREIDMIEKKDDSFSLTLNDNCQTLRPELDTNVIHQVDIETNMLLDILRQVQTNTEANELRVKNKTYTGAITDALSNEKLSSNEGKPASCNLWKKVDTDSTSSNSSSIRSETASPLTFKKVVRRCDRRNRRSEESTNKTLEETFAEITALSSKITLEVTASDLAEEKKDMVDVGEDVSQGNDETAEEESLIGETKKEKEKILITAAEENLIVSLEKPKSQEAKVTIGKRGRKPKNKPIYIGPSLPITTLTSKEENETKNRENLVNREDVEESGKCNKMATKHISIPISLTGISDGNLTPFQSEDDVSKKEEFPFDSNIVPITFDNTVIGSQEGLSTIPVGNENNVTKFSNQKRDLSANRKQDVKNSVKKQSKKLKSNQEDVLLLTNEDSTSKSSKSSSSAPKRGRKPKNQSHSLTEQRTTASAINSGKRKGKKDAKVTSVEDIKKPNVYPESYEDSQKDVDAQNFGATADKMLDEKLLLGLNESTYSVSSPKITKEPLHTESIKETISVSTVCNTIKPAIEEDPDPLKDIEKFIEANVNLLKKDYKIDKGSMDGCIPNKSVDKETVAGDVEKVFAESALQTVSKITQEYTEVTNVVNTFETPVDTPIAKPSATPPPKIPINSDTFTTQDVDKKDRIYNHMEVRKYKENKEKIRKRKEEIRRKRAEALRQTTANSSNVGLAVESTNAASKSQNESVDEVAGVLPIQDYLLSSDEEEADIKTECNNSPLIDKIVEGDKIVDELDALTTKRPLKRVLPPHRGLEEASTSSACTITASEKTESKKRKLEKKDKRKNKETDAKYRKLKEKFRCEIAGIIVHYLKPYRKDSCKKGRIKSNEDFNHLARKLTHFVMIKELKYCESVGQTLVVTESVKNKSREFIKKYMAKYGEAYVKPNNDPEFKDIPYTL